MKNKTKFCGDPECSTSTGICGTITQGKGELSGNGYWEFPCEVCEEHYATQDRQLEKGDKMLTKIHVTQEHINGGVCRRPSSCAIARALLSVLRPNLTVNCSQCGFSIIENHDVVYSASPMPEEVSNFITRFDRKQPVKPFEFEVEIPNEYLRGQEDPITWL